MNTESILETEDDELAVSTRCLYCGDLFLKKHKRHLFHSDKCRWAYDDKNNPRSVASNRTRCDRWYRDKHPEAGKVVSLSGAPFIGEYLPGAAAVISFVGGHVPPLAHGRHVHAVITQLLDIPHESYVPTFSASPYGTGWGVYSPNADAIRSIAGIRDVVRIGEQRFEISVGPLMKLRAPRVSKRGWRTLRVDTVTPVVIKSTSSVTGKTVVRQLGIGSVLNGSLTTFAKLRLGLDIGDKICCEVVAHETERVSTQLHGKLGEIRGFSGHVIVRCNAVGEWLLRASEQISLGSRVGFGFGRIRMSEFVDEKKQAAGKFFVTPHAVKRYIQRVHKGATYEQALGEIINELMGARFVKGRNGAELWRTGRPLRLRLVIGRANPGLPQVLTILPGTT
jgi:hypothetical protein